jgi:hypothetical protein
MLNKNMKLLMENFKNFIKEEQASNPQHLKQLSALLVRAYAGGPAALRAFLNSPHGKSAELKHILSAGETIDGQPKDDAVPITGPESVKVVELQPTQKEIDLMKSVAYYFGGLEGLINIIKNKTPGKGAIVKDGNLVIDGHHRWSGVMAIAPDGSINAYNVTWPGKDTSQKLASAQLAVAANVPAGQEQPSASDPFPYNIMGKSAEEIVQMCLSNVNKQTDKGAPGPFLNDEMIGQIIQGRSANTKIIYDWAGIGQEVTDPNQVRKAMAMKVGRNLQQFLKANPEAPARADMPQFDKKLGGPELMDIAPELAKGGINVNNPFVKEQLSKRIGQLVKEELRKIKR